jgi:hypothetical protein
MDAVTGGAYGALVSFTDGSVLQDCCADTKKEEIQSVEQFAQANGLTIDKAKYTKVP